MRIAEIHFHGSTPHLHLLRPKAISQCLGQKRVDLLETLLVIASRQPLIIVISEATLQPISSMRSKGSMMPSVLLTWGVGHLFRLYGAS